MDRAFTIVVNPAAGRGRMAKLLPVLGDAVSSAGLDAEIRMSAHPEQPVELAHMAIDAGRIPVACGGDGLVSMVAGAVADRTAAGDDAVLGLIPAGSGNDFARALGFDHADPLAAVEVLRTGTVERVDLGRVGERWFGCVMSTGFDAEANRWANTVTRLHGTALYVAATIRTLAVYRPLSFRVTVDGETHEHAAWFVAVGNGPSYGGGMRVAPAARLDDGILNVTVVGDMSRWDFLRTFPRVFSGTHVEHSAVHTFSGREVRVEAVGKGAVPVFADGEDSGALPVEVVAVRAALPVIASGHPTD